MHYITAKEASEKWGITTRQICKLCSKGRIVGAEKRSKVWMIPYNASKPEDGRKTDIAVYIEPALLLFNPDYLDKHSVRNVDEKTILFCKAQKLYFEGKIKESYEIINSILLQCDDEAYTFVLYIFKTLLLFRQGKKEECEHVISRMDRIINETERYRIEHLIYLTFFNRKIDFDDFPKGEATQFEIMPLFAFLEARKELNELIQTDIKMNIFNLEIICDSLVDKNCSLILAYYHIILAVYYNALAKEKAYMHHITKAVNILLPKKWYMPLAEYSATMDLSFIKDIDEQAYFEIMDLSKGVMMSYVKMGIFDDACLLPEMNNVTNVQLSMKLLQGKSINEIAEELGISRYKVKQYIDNFISVTGLSSKKDIKEFFLRNFTL